MSTKTVTIPPDFILGAAASAWQTEGWKDKREGQDSWPDLWYKNDRHVWHQGYGPAVATNFYQRFREDVQLMKQAGLTHYRTFTGRLIFNRAFCGRAATSLYSC